jgi:hypothetical protein
VLWYEGSNGTLRLFTDCVGEDAHEKGEREERAGGEDFARAEAKGEGRGGEVLCVPSMICS